MHLRNRLFALIALAALIAGAPAGAQQPPREAPRIAAWVAVGDEPALKGEPFVVRRGVGPGHDDVLIVSSAATPVVLSDAVRTLMMARSASGNAVPSVQILRKRPDQRHAATLPALPWTARVLDDVRQAPARELPGIGRVRAVRVWLPNTRLRRRVPPR
jgi:hypothetical protein